MKNQKHLKTDKQELLSLLKAGDKNFLDSFYLKERQNFLRWATKKYQIEQDVIIDVYQNAFIVLYEKAVDGQLDEISCRISTFLFSIGKNMLYKAFHKNSIRLKHELQIIEEQNFLNQEEEEDERSEAVRQVLQELTEPCRSILIHFYYEGKDVTQIAKEMAYKNKNVVKSQKVRCMKKLSELVKLKLAEKTSN